MGAGQRIRQDAALAASVHAVRVRGNLAGDSTVSGRAESRGAFADREVSGGVVDESAFTGGRNRDESLHRGDRGHQLAALAARLASGATLQSVDQAGSNRGTRRTRFVAPLRHYSREIGES